MSATDASANHPAPPPGQAKLTILADIRHLATIHVWHQTKPDAADLLGVSRDLAYEMARTGELPTIKLGRRRMVPVPVLRRMLGDLPSGEVGR